MGLARKKLKSRTAPRFRLDDDRRVMIRFRSSNNRFIQTSRVYDLSESGISFLSSTRLAPQIGDIIKMEFAPFSDLRMACLGRVKRVEEPHRNSKWAKFPNTVKVGIEFYNLPVPYQNALASSLKEAFRRARQPYQNRPIEVGPSVALDFSLTSRGVTYFVGFLLTVLGGLALYWVITTIQSNPPAIVAPWASGFFEKVIQK